ncbi:protein disulfide-isomerase A3-like [Tetranychus urticae]|uniref:protein disulfide-isomerase n=1 Tax=Tetranychus urticae TaxID=32264 RepID=T1KXJ3_TETUR|nr:protein disulfide-isomerase A3-like [Tetranychus urticae]XP_025017880.1 protein disulfide-isomerase A3-like [Tetranychus urticae]
MKGNLFLLEIFIIFGFNYPTNAGQLTYGNKAISANRLLDLSNSSLSSFKDILNHFDVVFVAFTASFESWRLIKYELIQAVDNLDDYEDPPLPIVRFDCSSESINEVCLDFNVAFDPTLVLIRYGAIDAIFHQSRDAETITQWIRKHSRLISTRFWSYTDLNNAVKMIDEVTVVAIFDDNKDELVELYHEASLKVTKKPFLSGVKFFHIIKDTAEGNDWELTELGGKSGRHWKYPLIILKRPSWLMTPLEEPIVLYPINSNEDIGQWIHRKAFGTIGWATKDNTLEDVRPPKIIVYYDHNFIQQPSFSHAWRNQIILASRRHLNIYFGIANSIVFKNKLKKYGIKVPRGKDSPVFMAYDEFGSMFVMRDEFSEKALAQFIQHFTSNLIAPIVDSFDAPIKQGLEVSPLTREITGNTFHKFVSGNSKDVLIRFTDPKCRYSSEFELYWNELAHELSGESTLELVTLDGSVNTIPSQFEVKQFPTVYLIPSKTKEKIKYRGRKSLHELIQFVAKHVNSELMSFNRDGSRRLQLIEKKLKTEF